MSRTLVDLFVLVRGLCAFHAKSAEGEKKGATETDWADLKEGRSELLGSAVCIVCV